MPRTGERGGPQTRARILEVSNRLFVERGFDAVTVAEVAREAGVSSVTVFNHFPTKEDLFLDRSSEVADVLLRAVRERGDVDALDSLRAAALRLADDRAPLSGLDPRSAGFLRTVAGSPALVARARAIAADLQHELAEALGGESLLPALLVGGYAAVLAETAQRRIAGASADEVEADHRARVERLFDALRNGVR